MSNNVESNGLGNQNDLVGRFFSEHIKYGAGLIVPVDQTPYRLYTQNHEIDGDLVLHGFIELPPDVVERERIMPCRTSLHMVQDRRVADSVHSFGYLADHVAALEAPEAVDYHVSRIVNDPLSVLRGALGRSADLLGRSGWPIGYVASANIEPAPNPDSRILLSGERDAFGLNRAAVNWQLTDLDRETIRRAQELIAIEVGRSGFGRLRMEMEDSEDLLLHGTGTHSHHMGTTRMHEDPRLGVTDANCRVHGLENLYIAGSSLFPSVGHANPTLTIVALALRLADHLNEEFRHGPIDLDRHAQAGSSASSVQ